MRLFFADLLKQTLIGAALGLPLVLCVLWLMQWMGEQWWLYVWLTWIAFNLLVLTVYPTLIAPLFNKFTPLEDAALKTRIEALLAKCGFRSQGLYVMDSSRRSSHGNAYFTGFGEAKRIVLFDTLIARLAPAEIEAVLAHELGHFKHHHVMEAHGRPVRDEPGVPVDAGLCNETGLVLCRAQRAGAFDRARAAAVLPGGAGIHLRAAPAYQPAIRASTNTRPTRTPRATRCLRT